jgi:hypothetical protein
LTEPPPHTPRRAGATGGGTRRYFFRTGTFSGLVTRPDAHILFFSTVLHHRKETMEKDTKEYEAPRIEDHGDLATLTAGQAEGESTDANFPVHTPKKDLTFSTP